MPRTKTQKPAKGTKGAYIELDESLYKAVKHAAVDEGTTFKQIVQEALKDYLSKRKGGKKQ